MDSMSAVVRDEDEYWELSGVASDEFSGGAAYMSGSYGTGSDHANNLCRRSGTFLIRLSAVNDPQDGPEMMLGLSG